jgi:hypothetical protein
VNIVNQLVILETEMKFFGQKLEQKPNIFEILNISHKELVHSNLLAWLLSVKNNQPIGIFFLKELLKTINKRYGYLDSLKELNKVNENDIHNSDVYREKLRTDILIHFPNPKIIIVIENKIFSNESDNQLKKYQNTIEKIYNRNYKYIYLYLTPEGYSPTASPSWLPISYYEINEIVSKLNIEFKSIEFIGSYQKILEGHIMKKSPLVSEALKIYKKNRQAFDFIFEVIDKKVIASEFIQEQLKYYLEKLNLVYLRGSKKYINFTLEGLNDILGDFGDGSWIKDFPKVYFSLEYLLDWTENDTLKVRFKAVVGPTTNTNLKKLSQFLLENKGGLFKLKGKEGDIRHTTVFSDIIFSSGKDPFDNDYFEKSIKIYFKTTFQEQIKAFNDYFKEYKQVLEKNLFK